MRLKVITVYELLLRARSCTRGSVALFFGITLPILLLASGAAVEYASMARAQSNLQAIADASALAGAKEISLANADGHLIEQVAKNYANEALQRSIRGYGKSVRIVINAAALPDSTGIEVSLEQSWRSHFGTLLGAQTSKVAVSAIAQVSGSAPICLLGLDENDDETVSLTKRAALKAPGCGVYSNSVHRRGLVVEADATLHTALTCSAGGAKLDDSSNLDPQVLTDCPKVPDLLEGRPMPDVGGCDHTEFRVKSGNHTLSPGVYCKGLEVTGTAKVTLEPGIYIITGDKLEVTKSATFEGEYVGLYLHGNDAKLEFSRESTINLSAPKDGLMAGLLIFESRRSNNKVKHRITSDNARKLLGTIYLPNGKLLIDSDAPIADQSAYTAIIALRVELDEGPTLHLNSDYSATDVPLPDSLAGGVPRLVH